MKNDSGFTLVEIVVVVVVLSILAAMLIPRMTGFLNKGRDEQNWEDAKNLLESAQAEFYGLYAVNGHDSDYKTAVAGTDGSKPGAISKDLNVVNEDGTKTKVYISDIHHKIKYPMTTEILRSVGYKVKYESDGTWKSDIPCTVMVITGDYQTYCDPVKKTYNPEKAYTVYAIIFNKNVGGDFFIMLKDGKKKYPKDINEFDEIINNIKDESDPENILVKQVYVLKAGHADVKNGTGTWDYYHSSGTGTYDVKYSSNAGKESDF